MSSTFPPPADWNDVAHAKLAAVLGAAKAEALMSELLGELRLTALTSADDLYRFGARLAAQGGFAGAVGGLLSVHAVIRGGGP